MTTDRPSVTSTSARGRSRRGVVAAALVVLALVLAACGSDDDAADGSGGEATTVEVRDAWARTSPSGQTNGAAYMVLRGGDEDDRLVGVSVAPDVAARAELHETVMADDGDAGSDMGGDMEMGAETDMGDGMEMGDASGGDGETDAMSGMMSMQEVAAIEVPAGGEVALEPGGYHVMLLDLAAPLADGETVELTLEFEQAGTVTATAEVRTA